MKVRARVKAPEYLPEWAKCCEESIKRDQSLGEFVVDLDDIALMGSGECYCCDAIVPEKNEVMMVSGTGNGYRFPLELLDLDEGPMEMPV